MTCCAVTATDDILPRWTHGQFKRQCTSGSAVVQPPRAIQMTSEPSGIYEERQIGNTNTRMCESWWGLTRPRSREEDRDLRNNKRTARQALLTAKVHLFVTDWHLGNGGGGVSGGWAAATWAHLPCTGAWCLQRVRDPQHQKGSAERDGPLRQSLC